MALQTLPPFFLESATTDPLHKAKNKQQVSLKRRLGRAYQGEIGTRILTWCLQHPHHSSLSSPQPSLALSPASVSPRGWLLPQEVWTHRPGLSWPPAVCLLASSQQSQHILKGTSPSCWAEHALQINMQISILKILMKPGVRCWQGQACHRGERRGLQTGLIQAPCEGQWLPSPTVHEPRLQQTLEHWQGHRAGDSSIPLTWGMLRLVGSWDTTGLWVGFAEPSSCGPAAWDGHLTIPLSFTGVRPQAWLGGAPTPPPNSHLLSWVPPPHKIVASLIPSWTLPSRRSRLRCPKTFNNFLSTGWLTGTSTGDRNTKLHFRISCFLLSFPPFLQVVALSSWCLLRDSIYYTLSVVALIVVSVWCAPHLRVLALWLNSSFSQVEPVGSSSAQSTFKVSDDEWVDRCLSWRWPLVLPAALITQNPSLVVGCSEQACWLWWSGPVRVLCCFPVTLWASLLTFSWASLELSSVSVSPGLDLTSSLHVLSQDGTHGHYHSWWTPPHCFLSSGVSLRSSLREAPLYWTASCPKLNVSKISMTSPRLDPFFCISIHICLLATKPVADNKLTFPWIPSYPLGLIVGFSLVKISPVCPFLANFSWGFLCLWAELTQPVMGQYYKKHRCHPPSPAPSVSPQSIPSVSSTKNTCECQSLVAPCHLWGQIQTPQLDKLSHPEEWWIRKTQN